MCFSDHNGERFNLAMCLDQARRGPVRINFFDNVGVMFTGESFRKLTPEKLRKLQARLDHYEPIETNDQFPEEDLDTQSVRMDLSGAGPAQKLGSGARVEALRCMMTSPASEIHL